MNLGNRRIGEETQTKKRFIMSIKKVTDNNKNQKNVSKLGEKTFKQVAGIIFRRRVLS